MCASRSRRKEISLPARSATRMNVIDFSYRFHLKILLTLSIISFCRFFFFLEPIEVNTWNRDYSYRLFEKQKRNAHQNSHRRRHHAAVSLILTRVSYLKSESELINDFPRSGAARWKEMERNLSCFARLQSQCLEDVYMFTVELILGASSIKVIDLFVLTPLLDECFSLFVC